MDVGTQIVNEHGTMVDILESRKIKLNAALTFWKKEDVTQLISYLLRTDDDSLFIDIIPFLAMGIREENSIGKKITLGVVIELLPILQRLLKSKFEDYLVASLDFLRIMIQHWYMDLRDMKRKATNKEQSMSLPQVFMYLITLQERIKKLRRRDGKIGEKAKVVDDILEQLT